MSPVLREQKTEFERLLDRPTDDFARPFEELMRSIAANDDPRRIRALAKLALILGATMTLADLAGRARIMREVKARGGEVPPGVILPAPKTVKTVVPSVPLETAVQDMAKRAGIPPEQAVEITDVYQKRVVPNLVRDADQVITSHVEGFVKGERAKGKPPPTARETMADLGDFSRSYADTTYRTTLNTAHTAGQFQQAMEEGVREILPAFERWEITDSAVRRGRPQDNGENHLAANGLIADTRDPIWRRVASPSGFG